MATGKETHDALSRAVDLLAAKILDDERMIGVAFPYATGPDGQWRTMLASQSAGYRGGDWSHGNWFGGFFVGLLVAAHLATGRAVFLDLARERMHLVDQRADDPNTHDIGFIFWSSALRLLRVTGEEAFAATALRSAARLRARLVPTQTGAYISAWGPLSDPRGVASSAIDTMANIPLLYWAAERSGEDGYRLCGEAHARKTMDAFIRPDNTLYHAVEYDPRTGARLKGFTFQGYGDESSWSRGAGWAVYGLAATANATRDPDFLETAERLAERWLEQLGNRTCPPWDFDDPDDKPTRDSSAAAIMAAALLDVAALQADEVSRDLWQGRALRLLLGLTETCLATSSDHRGLLKHGCYSKPHDDGTDSAVMFGDYFFVEAIMRVLRPAEFVDRFSPIGL